MKLDPALLREGFKEQYNVVKEKDELSFKEICSELGITDYDLDTNSPLVQIWKLEDFLKRNNLKSESDFDKFAEAAAAKNIMACATFDDAITDKRMLIIKVNKEHPIGQVISTFCQRNNTWRFVQ